MVPLRENCFENDFRCYRNQQLNRHRQHVFKFANPASASGMLDLVSAFNEWLPLPQGPSSYGTLEPIASIGSLFPLSVFISSVSDGKGRLVQLKIPYSVTV